VEDDVGRHDDRAAARLLASVFELVDGIEESFAAALAPGEFDRLRETLVKLANQVDPVGLFGAGDEPPKRQPRRRSRPAC
jgi:hypothetical protein